MAEKLITTADVAERLNVRQDKVYELIHSGVTMPDPQRPSGRVVKLPAVRQGSLLRAVWKFRPSDVERFIDATCQCDAAPPEPVKPKPLMPAKQFVIRRPANAVLHGSR